MKRNLYVIIFVLLLAVSLTLASCKKESSPVDPSYTETMQDVILVDENGDTWLSSDQDGPETVPQETKQETNPTLPSEQETESTVPSEQETTEATTPAESMPVSADANATPWD